VKEPTWFDRADCLAIHEMMLAQHGGRDGVRDEVLLESALNRSRHLHEYGRPSACELAASYAGGVIRNHPFNDGNRRTGFMLAAAFLELNGFRLTASEEEIYRQTLAFAAGETDEAGYAGWLARVSVPARSRRKLRAPGAP
jgi:death on curing protein